MIDMSHLISPDEMPVWPLLEAIRDGKKLYIACPDGSYSEISEDFITKLFFAMPAEDYRIAPEPQVFYANEYESDFGRLYSTKEKAENAIREEYIGPYIKTIRLVEDLDYNEDG